MKNRLLAVVFSAMFVNVCYAKTYEMNNNAGGKIVLTDRDCKGYEPLKQAYAYHQSGTVFDGCWGYIDKKIHVYYPSVDEKRIYNPSDFREVIMY